MKRFILFLLILFLALTQIHADTLSSSSLYSKNSPSITMVLNETLPVNAVVGFSSTSGANGFTPITGIQNLELKSETDKTTKKQTLSAEGTYYPYWIVPEGESASVSLEWKITKTINGETTSVSDTDSVFDITLENSSKKTISASYSSNKWTAVLDSNIYSSNVVSDYASLDIKTNSNLMQVKYETEYTISFTIKLKTN